MTTEMPFDHPDYLADARALLRRSPTAALAARLDAGRDVALLAEGDPLFYGSFMHLFVRLKRAFRLRDRARRHRHGRLLGGGGGADDLGRRRADRAARHACRSTISSRGSKRCDAAVVMKLGRNFAKVRAAFAEAGLLDRAIYVERGTMAGEAVTPLAGKARRRPRPISR